MKTNNNFVRIQYMRDRKILRGATADKYDGCRAMFTCAFSGIHHIWCTRIHVAGIRMYSTRLIDLKAIVDESKAHIVVADTGSGMEVVCKSSSFIPLGPNRLKSDWGMSLANT